MAASPRIVTVDTTGSIAQVVRAACQLVDQPVILTEVRGGNDALDEIQGHSCNLLITAVELADDMKGYELAMQARQKAPDLGIIILADLDDPEWDEETIAQSPFVYMHRPVDAQQFIRALLAGISGEDMLAAMVEASNGGGGQPIADMGPIPKLDAEVSRGIVDGLLTEVGAMAIILSSRDGHVLLERGAVGYLDREQLTSALLPMVHTTISMGEMVGGRASTIHFYDGDNYDVYVLSIGLHHFLCLVFDGQAGHRQFGSVNRFGRRAAEDLIALLGTAAYTIQKPQPPTRERKRKTEAATPAAADGSEDFAPIPRSAEAPPPAEPEEFKLDPIADLDLSIFDDLDNVNPEDAEALFDLDNLLDVANENRRQGGSIGFDEAQQLGILPSLDNNK